MARGLWRTTFIGGFIAWLWMTVSWTVLPWHCNNAQTFPNEKAAVEAISAQAKENGIYYYPSLCKESEKTGNTRIFLSINRDAEASMLARIITSLVIYFIGGLLTALIIMPMAASKYGTKLFAVSMIGLIIGCMGTLPAWNWWSVPFDYALLMIADNLIAWLLAGLAIAGFIHPKRHASS